MNSHQFFTKKFTLILFYLIIIVNNFGFTQDHSELYREFSFEKNLTLSDIGEDYFFGMPLSVIPDSLGNLYVADDQQKKIMVFNSKGDFLYSIGRSGKGPGEFLKTSSMVILPDDELLVFDFFMRRFTKFSLQGDVLDTYVLPKNIYMYPDVMYYLDGVGILAFYRSLEGSRAQVPPEKDFLIHILSEDLKTIKHEFVPISETVDLSSNFEKYFEGGMFKGSISVTDTTVTLAPFFYRGEILQYHKKHNWKLTDKFEGYVETKETYTPYDDYREVIGKGYFSNSKAYGPTIGILKNESLGVFRKNNGDFLYLGLIEIGNERKVYVNLFDSKGLLKAHGPVTNLQLGLQKNDFFRMMRFYWIDEKDQLYAIDGAEDGFFVYRGTIEMKE